MWLCTLAVVDIFTFSLFNNVIIFLIKTPTYCFVLLNNQGLYGFVIQFIYCYMWDIVSSKIVLYNIVINKWTTLRLSLTILSTNNWIQINKSHLQCWCIKISNLYLNNLFWLFYYQISLTLTYCFTNCSISPSCIIFGHCCQSGGFSYLELLNLYELLYVQKEQ